MAHSVCETHCDGIADDVAAAQEFEAYLASFEASFVHEQRGLPEHEKTRVRDAVGREHAWLASERDKGNSKRHKPSRINIDKHRDAFMDSLLDICEEYPMAGDIVACPCGWRPAPPTRTRAYGNTHLFYQQAKNHWRDCQPGKTWKPPTAKMRRSLARRSVNAWKQRRLLITRTRYDLFKSTLSTAHQQMACDLDFNASVQTNHKGKHYAYLCRRCGKHIVPSYAAKQPCRAAPGAVPHTIWQGICYAARTGGNAMNHTKSLRARFRARNRRHYHKRKAALGGAKDELRAAQNARFKDRVKAGLVVPRGRLRRHD